MDVAVDPEVKAGDGGVRNDSLPVVGICGDPSGEPAVLFLRAVASGLPARFLLVLPELRPNLFSRPGGSRIYTRTFAGGACGAVTVHDSTRPVPMDLVHDFYGWPPVEESLKPCVFAPAEAEALSLDKRANKEVIRSAGVRTPRWQVFEPEEDLSAAAVARRIEDWAGQIGLRRLAVKPAARSGGSGVAFFRISEIQAAGRWVAAILRRNEAVLVEEFIRGLGVHLWDGERGEVSHVRANVLRSAEGNYATVGLRVAIVAPDSPSPHRPSRLVPFEAVREWEGWAPGPLARALSETGTSVAEAFVRDLAVRGLADHTPDQVAVDLLPAREASFCLELDTGGVGTEVRGATSPGSHDLIAALVRRAARNRRQRREDILDAFHKAVPVPPGPNRPHAWTAAVNLFLESGDEDLAVRMADAGLTRHPETSSLLFARAVLRLARGEVDTAAADLRALLSQEPDHPPTLSLLTRFGIRPSHEPFAMEAS